MSANYAKTKHEMLQDQSQSQQPQQSTNEETFDNGTVQ
jgi:hypothetical protein